MNTLLGWLLHKYIREGEEVDVYYTDGAMTTMKVLKIEGYGKYAAVRVGTYYTVMRRDGFFRNTADGRWAYRYYD